MTAHTRLRAPVHRVGKPSSDFFILFSGANDSLTLFSFLLHPHRNGHIDRYDRNSDGCMLGKNDLAHGAIRRGVLLGGTSCVLGCVSLHNLQCPFGHDIVGPHPLCSATSL